MLLVKATFCGDEAVRISDMKTHALVRLLDTELCTTTLSQYRRIRLLVIIVRSMRARAKLFAQAYCT
jgi:hypothetical protein